LRTLNGVGVTWDGLLHGASLILFIDHGVLALLEGFTYDDPWPESMENYKLFHENVVRLGGAETNLEQLNAAWPSTDIREH
jgi:hypothetical protein